MSSITVILCTYNRCRTLAKALESAAALRVPSSIDWEVLVVDNNSRDETRQIAEGFCRHYPGRFRYIFERRQGLCHARNAGIQAARGEILAFMDDDVVVPHDWLHNLTASLHDGDWAGAGGRIRPDWPSPPPEWLPSEGRWALAPLVVFEQGDQPGPLSEAPFGANMAFRKEMFEKYGTFRTDLGRVGNNLMTGEDTEFGSRLLGCGERLRYEPSAVVHHPVTPDRLHKGYFLRWHFDEGRGQIRQFGVEPHAEYFVLGVPLYLFRRLAAWTFRWLVRLEKRPRFGCKLKVWGVSGQIAECYRLRPSTEAEVVLQDT